jgi:signal transduction histidine kinase
MDPAMASIDGLALVRREARRVARVVSGLAIVLGLFVALTAPLGYIYQCYRYEDTGLQAEAQRRAALVSKHLYGNSRLWRFEVLRLEEILGGDEPGRPILRYRLRTLPDDKVVIEMGPQIQAPLLARSVDVFDGARRVASLTVEGSLRPALIEALLLGMASAAIAFAIFVVARVLPLRVVRNAFRHLTEAHSALAEARAEAEATSKAKSEFLASMSHELRTPLNAILGFSEITKEEMFGPMGNARYLEYQGSIHRCGTHLLSLIDDVLDISKAEAGMEELREAPFEVLGVVDAALRIVSADAGKGGLRLLRDVEDGLPKIFGDERRIGQVLLNLLSNAVKFTEPGGDIRLTVRRETDGGALFQVADSGVGLAPEHLQRAFTPFGQVENRYTKKHRGSGLGLPLAKRLVELHGGSLGVESQPGVGTTMSVRLPASRMLAPASEPVPGAVQAA